MGILRNITEMSDAWVIFDADNTSWNIEHFYDEAREELCSFIAEKGFGSKVPEKYQRERDVELMLTYGYSACRFARSFEDTVIKFLGNDIDAIIHARSLALGVFERSPTVNPGVQELFQKLKGNFKIGLITAGEKWVQERRLSDFHLKGEVDDVHVVESKTPSVFQCFIDDNGVDVAKSWMVGDSLKSDIAPAQSVGLRTIWYHADNWREVENNGYKDAAKKAVRVKSMDEIHDVIKGGI